MKFFKITPRTPYIILITVSLLLFLLPIGVSIVNHSSKKKIAETILAVCKYDYSGAMIYYDRKPEFSHTYICDNPGEISRITIPASLILEIDPNYIPR